MSQFDTDGADLAIEEMIESLERMREQERARIRAVGYAEYDHWQWRLRRAWQWLTRQPIMSRAKWNSFVDRTIK